MADIATLANYAEVFGAAVVAGGVAFAVVQIREGRTQRRQAATMEFLRNLQTEHFEQALRLIWGIPRGLSAEEFRAHGPQAEAAALRIVWACENVGVMVFQRVLDLPSVDRLIGGIVRDSWLTMAAYVEDERRRLDTQNFAEWFQWLARQLEAHGNPRKREGAHNVYQNWRP